MFLNKRQKSWLFHDMAINFFLSLRLARFCDNFVPVGCINGSLFTLSNISLPSSSWIDQF